MRHVSSRVPIGVRGSLGDPMMEESEPAMLFNRLIHAVAVAGLTVLPLGGCREKPEPSVAPTPAPADALDPKLVGRVIESDTEAFHAYLFDPAKASGASFPAFNKWVDATAAAIEYRDSPGSVHEDIVLAAQAELAPFRLPNPETKDLELVAAINEETALASLGPILIRAFRDEPEATRLAAARYLRDNFRIGPAPPGR